MILSKGPETLFKERVLKDLRALPRTWAVKIQQVAIRGTPDILCSMNGYFVALELKASEKAKIDELQMYTISMIANSNAIALITFPANWPLTLAFLKDTCLKGIALTEEPLITKH